MLEQGIVSSRVTFSCYDLLRLSLCSVDLLYNITFLPPPPSSNQTHKQQHQTQTPKGLGWFLKKNPARSPQRGSRGPWDLSKQLRGVLGEFTTLDFGFGGSRSSHFSSACCGVLGGSKSGSVECWMPQKCPGKPQKVSWLCQVCKTLVLVVGDRGPFY